VNSRVTPKFIDHIDSNEIFVFGSNKQGRHGRGAAKVALSFGAVYGVGYGLRGNTYAIPTRYFVDGKHSTIGTPFYDGSKSIVTISLNEIKNYIDELVDFAEFYKHLKFLVTEIGCNNAGYTPKDIAPLFERSKDLENVYLPESFWNVLS
jgi:hypothetical protein